MKFIDKTSAPQEGWRIVNNYLRHCYSNNPTYEYFKKKPERNQLRELLVKEQAGLCCYCMRKLEPTHITLEHVIPNKSAAVEFAFYKAMPITAFSRVKHIDDFVSSIFRANSSFLYFPHTVAYENLTASCDGLLQPGNETRCCCNNKRGNARIYPIMLDSAIASSVCYGKSGILYFDPPADPLIQNSIGPNALDLNNQTLKDIRALWGKIKNSHLDLSRGLMETDVLEVLGDNAPERFHKFYLNPYYFNLLKDYDWFYLYPYYS